MSRRLKTLPKHVREVRSFLKRIGADAITPAMKGRYVLSWRAGGVAMHVNLPTSPGGNAVEAAQATIRHLLRQHGVPVPA